MLSAESAAVVRATLPAVAGALDEITTRFYGAMFRDRPELLDGMFNRGNQASGAQRRALAGSIAGFARALLARPDERPDALLSRIAHKHTAVGVTDDQYTIVHKYLFGAIAEVLGEAVTPEVAAAWDEVYWLMAGALIAQEARLYQEAGVEPGDVWQPWTVVERRQETADVVSFVLRPAGGGPAPAARAGQYVSVRVLMPDGVHQVRQYSLSGDPGRELRRITVKRVAGTGGDPDGEVSELLHRTVHVGDELTLSVPFGDISLDEADTPLVLISAGIGCTPMVGMLDRLAVTGSARQVLVLHADTAPEDHALRAETRKLTDRLPHGQAVFWYERPDAAEPDTHAGLLDLDAVELPADATVYLCGPLPFMRAVRAELLGRGVPARLIRYEVFGPDLWLPDAAA
ncbi:MULTISPECIES: globin domain-containing protein [unclassified Streptomyces]|uniref:globin domain-containing protein n=1 Tax=unclassified Streptomyces TaxID=2593676 RepID=UPI001F03A6B1|nr:MULTISPECIES: globin domain-containing protein [unclassified Streptomyces]MCH0567604.1 hemin transporter [Streptomyces sp. MUM 2J]MCH0571053.1 hemin transporter [Streptomyces sp. MUM 136J]